MKICNTCKTEKLFSEFFKRKDAYKDPYRSDCKSCLAAKAANRYKASPEKWAARDKAWREANPEREKERGKEWRQKNKEIASRKSIEWAKANPEKRKDILKTWKINNPEKYRQNNSRTRLKKHCATPKWLTKEHRKQINEIYLLAVKLSVETGTEHQVDHIIPLSGKRVRGLHVPWNLRVIPAKDNRLKSNKTDF